MPTPKKSSPLFTKDAQAFLRELAQHNNKAWFEANKARYEEELRQPALELVRALEGPLHKLSPHLLVSDKKVGGSLMRIHRDVRFAKDKSPYNTHLALRFHLNAPKGESAPGFYIGIDADGLTLGAGLYGPDASAMAKVRARIDAEPKAWKRARDAKAAREAGWAFEGESLKRPPKGFDADHPLLEDLKRKSWCWFAKAPRSLVTRSELPAEAMARFRSAKGLVGFLAGALGLDY